MRLPTPSLVLYQLEVDIYVVADKFEVPFLRRAVAISLTRYAERFSGSSDYATEMRNGIEDLLGFLEAVAHIVEDNSDELGKFVVDTIVQMRNHISCCDARKGRLTDILLSMPFVVARVATEALSHLSVPVRVPGMTITIGDHHH
jgi:hypothetical protein